MSPTTVRPSFLKLLYNNNPFYVISAVLMAYAVRATYGELEIGAINCRIMMGVLATYTLVLAVIGVLIVRCGKVWEDARSILVLLLLLFLAVSVSADDLFVKMTSSEGGTALLLCGYLFSAIVSEVVLRGAGIRLGWRFRCPYHLMLALFYVAPWLCAPQLFQRSQLGHEWMLLLFPVAGAVLLLGLLPAIRRGPAYVADSGTPWPWPWFPWIAFGVLATAVAFRSFVLCMTFGPHGPIWERHGKNLVISFDTMWGTYFLVPLGLAILLLLLEAGLVANNRRLLKSVLKAAPVLLLLSVPLGGDYVFRRFLTTVTDTLGSPMWLTTWLLVGFYGWAWLRRVSGAGIGILGAVAVLSVVGPKTINVDTFVEPQWWAFFVIGVVSLVYGVWTRSSRCCTLSAVAATVGLWLVIPQTQLEAYCLTICYHFLLLAIVILGFVYHDRFAKVLFIVAAVQMPLASLVVVVSPRAAEVPISWRLLYVVLLAAYCLSIAWKCRNQWYLYAFAATATVAAYAVTVSGFRRAVDAVGRPAMTAFAWSVGALLLAFLISAHKASWLPQRLLPRWNCRKKQEQPAPDDEAAVVAEESTELAPTEMDEAAEAAEITPIDAEEETD